MMQQGKTFIISDLSENNIRFNYHSLERSTISSVNKLYKSFPINHRFNPIVIFALVNQSIFRLENRGLFILIILVRYGTKVGLKLLFIDHVLPVIIGTPDIHLSLLVAAHIWIHEFLVWLVSLDLRLIAICIVIILDRDIERVMFTHCLFLQLLKDLLTSLGVRGLLGHVGVVLQVSRRCEQGLTVDRVLPLKLIRVTAVALVQQGI